MATLEGDEGLKLHHCIVYKFLDQMEKLSYFLKIGKYKFKQSKIEFLGWLITKERITVDPMKAAGLVEWPRELYNLKEVKRILEILGYQWPFI